MPSISSEHTRSTCCFLVSSFLTEVVQQIHSLRASGVMSSHAACAAGEARSAFLKSAGNACTVPLESAFFATGLFYDVRVKTRFRPNASSPCFCSGAERQHDEPLRLVTIFLPSSFLQRDE
jgi:hypothetical protein